MKCVIVAGNIRVFGKAIHSLAKIGTELYLEDRLDGLALKTVNQSRCGYASIVFLREFFHLYDDGLEPGDDDTARIKCKLCMKSCVAIFRSLATIEKMVEQCTLTFEGYDTEFSIRLDCRYGIVKKYELKCLESEVLQAVFNKSNCPNIMGAPLRLLNDALAPLPNSLEEVTLCVTKECVIFKNYVQEDEEQDTIKLMHTEMKLEEAEFDRYTIGTETEVTFTLKELRAAVLFADTTDEPMLVQFSGGGRPIIFTVESRQMYEANYVMATLADDGAISHKGSQAIRISGTPQRPVPTTSSADITTDTTDTEQAANGAAGPSNRNRSTKQTRGIPEKTTSRIAAVHLGCDQTDEEEDWPDEMTDIIPRSPPNKRFKSIFTSVTPQPTEGSYRVLASDTDDET